MEQLATIIGIGLAFNAPIMAFGALGLWRIDVRVARVETKLDMLKRD